MVKIIIVKIYGINIYIFIIATLIFACPKVACSDAGELRFGVGVSVNHVDTRQSDFKKNEDASYLFGGSIYAQGHLTRWLRLEALAILSDFQFFQKSSNQTFIKERGTRLHLPITFRAPIFDYFSVGAGFYGSYRIGSVETGDLSQRTSASDTGEHGIEGVFGVHVPIDDNEHWINLDYRQAYSLTPRDEEARTWNFFIISVSRAI